MIIAANIGVCDEIELIDRHLQHLTAIGVDHVVVTDTGSTDGTVELLQRHADRGEIVLRREDPDDPEAFHYANRMLRETRERFAPDWILFGDADEFHLPRGGSLREVLARANTDLLRVRRFNVAVGTEGPLWPDALTPATHDRLQLIVKPVPDFQAHLAAHPDTPWILGFAAPKLIARATAVAQGIGMAAHAPLAGGAAPLSAPTGDLLIAHVPVSSRERFRRKLDNIAQVFRRVGHRYAGSEAWHWRRWLELAQAGQGDAEFERQVFDAARLAELRAAGTVRSAAEWFRARAARAAAA